MWDLEPRVRTDPMDEITQDISSDLQESAPFSLLSNGLFQTAEDLGGLRVKSSQSFRHPFFVTRTLPTYFPRRSVKPNRQTFLLNHAGQVEVFDSRQ